MNSSKTPLTYYCVSSGDNKGPTRGGGNGVNSLLEFHNQKLTSIDNFHHAFRGKKSPWLRPFDTVNKRLRLLDEGVYNYQFYRKLRAKNADLYVCHDTRCAEGLLKRGLPVALVYHGQGDSLYERESFGKATTQPVRARMLQREEYAFKHSVALAFPSKGAKQAYIETSELPAELLDKIDQRAQILYNTSTLNEVTQASSITAQLKAEAKGRRIITTISNLNTAKGIDLIPKFLSQINDFSQKFLWLLIGSKGGDIKEIEREVQQQRLQKGFMHIPRVPHQDIAPILNNSEYYLMHHRKSIFDIATLEAMHCGAIPILSPIGGNLELNRDDNILYVDQLTQFVEKMSDTKFIDLMGKRNQQVYKNFFGPEQFLVGYKKFIEDAINA